MARSNATVAHTNCYGWIFISATWFIYILHPNDLLFVYTSHFDLTFARWGTSCDKFPYVWLGIMRHNDLWHHSYSDLRIPLIYTTMIYINMTPTEINPRSIIISSLGFDNNKMNIISLYDLRDSDYNASACTYYRVTLWTMTLWYTCGSLYILGACTLTQYNGSSLYNDGLQ